jgi:multidrug resistance efflux pump
MSLDQATSLEPGQNGQLAGGATLSERVRSLRLSDRAIHSSPFPLLPWFLVFVLVLACGGLAYYAFLVERSPASSEAVAELTEKKGEENPLAVSATPAPSKSGKALEAKGYIVAVHQVQVSPKVGGMVMELRFEEGMRVKEGDTLAILDKTDYQADYDRTAAQAESAKRRYLEMQANVPLDLRRAAAELSEAVARRDVAKKEYERVQNLERTRSASPQEVDKARADLLTAEAKVDQARVNYELLDRPRLEKVAAAKADWDLAEADKRKAKSKLDDTTVVAPISGIILTKKAEKGNMVNPAFAKDLSTSLCEMADLTDMEVDLAIAERDIAKVAKGQKCKLYAEAFPDRIYDGYVSRIMPIADRGRTSVPVRVKILIPKEEEGQFLRPDMGAVVTFFKDKK